MKNKRADAGRSNLSRETKFSGTNGDTENRVSLPRAGLATIPVDLQSVICDDRTYMHTGTAESPPAHD